MENKKVIRTERGWAGHYCLADKCLFRRNTLLNCNDIFIVISTVGVRLEDGKCTEVGPGRYYETMAFFSNSDDLTYHDANVSQNINFDSKCYLCLFDDNQANDMHENVVEELTNKLKKGEIKYASTS